MRAYSFGNIYRPHKRSVTVIDGPAFDPALISTLARMAEPFPIQLEHDTPESIAFARGVAVFEYSINATEPGGR